MHASELICPNDGEKVPASQGVHSATAVKLGDDDHVPDGHGATTPFTQ